MTSSFRMSQPIDNDKFNYIAPRKTILDICVKNVYVLCYSAPGLRFSEKSPHPLTRDTHLSYLVPAGTSPLYLFVYVYRNTMYILNLPGDVNWGNIIHQLRLLNYFDIGFLLYHICIITIVTGIPWAQLEESRQFCEQEKGTFFYHMIKR